MTDRIYDLFITHAWRYHDDWTRVGEMFDKALGDTWRNFSVPWYDPALDPNTEVGKRLVHRWLEQQIVPTCGVILLSSVYENKSAQKWVVLEAELAHKYQKRIVGLPTFGAATMASKRRRWSTSNVPGTPKKSSQPSTSSGRQSRVDKPHEICDNAINQVKRVRHAAGACQGKRNVAFGNPVTTGPPDRRVFGMSDL